METVTDFILGLQNHHTWFTRAMKLEDACSLEESYDQPRQPIKKQRHYFTKVCLVKAMVFPVVMCGCESWTIKKAEW